MCAFHPLLLISALLAANASMPADGGASGAAKSPITAVATEKEGFATFTNRLHPGNRIGYRFQEHTPLVHGDIPADLKAAGIDAEEVARLEKAFAARPGLLKHVTRIEREQWVTQQWTFYVVPVEDGIEMLMVIETGEAGLNAYYGIQQCFRMSGRTNEEWRKPIAEAPAFSEYDLWNVDEKDKTEKSSLTHVLRKGKWETLPAMTEAVGARTPLGVRVDTLRTDGKLETMPKIGPYEAKAFDPIDTGLITRTNKDRTWICGIYWDRSSHVTNHHPADCLHNIVNIGGMPPHARRAVRGKIYWFKGTPDDLLRHWKKDFPAPQ